MAATVTIPQTIPRSLPQRQSAAGARVRLWSALRFASAPALVPTVSFGLGIAGAMHVWVTPAWLLLGLLLLGGVAGFSAYRAPRVVVLALAAVFAVLGCLAAELERPVDAQQQLGLLAAEALRHEPITVTGTVVRVEAPHATAYQGVFEKTSRVEAEQRVDLQLRGYVTGEGQQQPLHGGLRLSLYAPTANLLPPLQCGAVVQALVALRGESTYGDPGVWDAAAYMRTQGIGASASAKAVVARVVGSERPTWPCKLHALQGVASSRVVALASAPAGSGLEQRLPAFFRLSATDVAMLTAMLTGDRSYLQHGTRVGFERTGSFHLLVVSGLHLAIFSSVILGLTRWVGVARVAGTLVTLGMSLGYAVFTGFGEPVQRSFWMVALYLVGRLLYRERFALQALAVAALVLLAADPRALAGASLQMTLLTVIAVGGFAVPLVDQTFGPMLRATERLWLPALDAAMPPRMAQLRVMLRLLCRHLQPIVGRRLARWAVPSGLHLLLRASELVLLSSVVELVMALPMALYFHRITVLALPVNVLILPLLGVLLPAAMLCFVTQMLVPALAFVPATVTAMVLHIVTGIVDSFAGVAWGNYRIPGPPTVRIVLWLVVVGAGVVCVRGPRRLALAATPLALALAMLLAVAPQKVVHRAGALEIAVLDVGQGDAILLVTPDGKTMLVDAGGIVGEGGRGNFDIGEDVVSPALWARGIQRLDAVAISHAHEDHIGGMPAVLANFRPGVLLVGNNPLSEQYRSLLAQAAGEQIPVVAHRQGDRWQVGSVTGVQVLWPSASYQPKAAPGNDDSLVLRVAYGGTSALLEGDAQALAEAGMLRYGVARADVLKVGHHGSLSSSTPDFLRQVSPGVAAISCGPQNFYGHPKPGTLEKLQSAAVETYRTDLTGQVKFLLDGQRVTVAR